MSTFHETLDVLLLGDNHVGKSTLINCYLTRHFSDIPSGALKSKIQLEGALYGCNTVNINLCDTLTNGVVNGGHNNAWSENLEKAILDASAIVIVGAWDNEQSIKRIEGHWLPLVTKLCESRCIPVIIVVNKSDKVGVLRNLDLMNQQYRQCMCDQLSTHPLVRHVFQASCVDVATVQTAFDVAIQCILYPLQQLIVTERDYCFKSVQQHRDYAYLRALSRVKRRKQQQQQQSLQIITDKFLIALRRIFHIVDRDHNHLLTDDEMLYYYRECLLLNSMQMQQFRKLKSWLSSISNACNQPNDDAVAAIRIRYICRQCVTFEGFVQIHLILIQLNKYDCVWKSLEKFGYRRKNMSIAADAYPSLPSERQSHEWCGNHNAIVRPMLAHAHPEPGHCSRQGVLQHYELNVHVAGFLMSIFLHFCQHAHDEHAAAAAADDASRVHEYNTCYTSRDGLLSLLHQYNIGSLPFEHADLMLVGCMSDTREWRPVTLTAWLSLWSLLMWGDAALAMHCLTDMGAPMVFPSRELTPRWTDFMTPQVRCAQNTHQRFLNCLVVTYPYDARLLQRFILSSVQDFSLSSHATPPDMQHTPLPHAQAQPQQQQRRTRSRNRIPSASRTGSLSPIREAAHEAHALASDGDERKYYDADDEKTPTQNMCTDDSRAHFARLNTTFCLKPTNGCPRYDYGMLNGEAQFTRVVDGLYREHHRFLWTPSDEKRKPLISVNLLQSNRGIDAYHTLLTAWPQHAADADACGNDGLFRSANVHKTAQKQLRQFDAVIYLHTPQSLNGDASIARLFNICREQRMPVIPVQIVCDGGCHSSTATRNTKSDDEGFDSIAVTTAATTTTTPTTATSKTMQHTSVYEQSTQQLRHILQRYDLRQRVNEWVSFAEDQSRFNLDLIENLHFREKYIPKTNWQIRKQKLQQIAWKGTQVAAIGAVVYVFAPVHAVGRYLRVNSNNNTSMTESKEPQNENASQLVSGTRAQNITFRKKDNGDAKTINNPNRNHRAQRQIAFLVTFGVLASVFAGYCYRRYGHSLIKTHDAQSAETTERRYATPRGATPSYLHRLNRFFGSIYSKSSDDDDDDDDMDANANEEEEFEEDDDELTYSSLNSFSNWKSKKSD